MYYLVDNYDGWLFEFKDGEYEFISPTGKRCTYPGDQFNGQLSIEALDDAQDEAAHQDVWVQWEHKTRTATIEQADWA